MSLGLRADPTNTSAVISVAGTDQVVITNAGNVTANTFTGALAGNATSATALSTSTGAAPSYSARAWVNFDGTRNVAGTVDATNTNRFIRGSGNVSNVLRNSTGDYTVNFSTAMPDANYAVVFGTQTAAIGDVRPTLSVAVPPAAANVTVLNWVSTGAAGPIQDATIFCVTIFR